jgi:putative transcriptional regulator
MERTLKQIRASRPRINRAKMQATSETDIERQMVEDGQKPGTEPGGFVTTYPAGTVRKQLGMTQEAFAEALSIPVATIRNWEQGRTRPDPAAQSLLRAVARDPDAVLKALNGLVETAASNGPAALS